MIRLFRIIAFLEGCSFLLLGITMMLKYRYAMPGPNYVVGMAHGVLFIIYMGVLARISWLRIMSAADTVWSVIASLLPAGTFIADYRIFRHLPSGHDNSREAVS